MGEEVSAGMGSSKVAASTGSQNAPKARTLRH